VNTLSLLEAWARAESGAHQAQAIGCAWKKARMIAQFEKTHIEELSPQAVGISPRL
jgi:hypothetical protein